MKIELPYFFEEYMFQGKKKLPHRECDLCDFFIEVFKYDPEKRLFIGRGKDNHGRLSSIIGVINPKSENEAGVEMRQTVFSRPTDGYIGYVLDGNLRKTEENIVLSGNYEFINRYERYPFELKVVPRKKVFPGWMDIAMGLVLPKKED